LTPVLINPTNVCEAKASGGLENKGTSLEFFSEYVDNSKSKEMYVLMSILDLLHHSQTPCRKIS